jgi:hypothetical protein
MLTSNLNAVPPDGTLVVLTNYNQVGPLYVGSNLIGNDICAVFEQDTPTARSTVISGYIIKDSQNANLNRFYAPNAALALLQTMGLSANEAQRVLGAAPRCPSDIAIVPVP